MLIFFLTGAMGAGPSSSFSIWFVMVTGRLSSRSLGKGIVVNIVCESLFEGAHRVLPGGSVSECQQGGGECA